MWIKHWELPKARFGERSLVMMERDFLVALDYRLGISEDDLLDSAPCHPVLPKAKAIKISAVRKRKVRRRAHRGGVLRGP